MELRELQKHIGTLATLGKTPAPVLSCYLNVEEGVYRTALDEQIRVQTRYLSGDDLSHFVEALARIESTLEEGFPPATRGVAIFARGGTQPFFLALQFRVPLPNLLIVDSTPGIYPLVDLKDTYSRFVLMLATERSSRILGIHLGSVVQDISSKRTELRRRAGREWTKDRLESHRQERVKQFLQEQIQVLGQVVKAGRYGHIVLAGNPRITAMVAKGLPDHLSAKLVAAIPASEHDQTAAVVAAGVARFVEWEEQDSQANVEKLLRGIHARGFAVAGTYASLEALKKSQVDVLVLAKEYDQQREEMVKMAEQSGAHVEVVNHSDDLMNLGGVGCLLRRLPAERFAGRAA